MCCWQGNCSDIVLTAKASIIVVLNEGNMMCICWLNGRRQIRPSMDYVQSKSLFFNFVLVSINTCSLSVSVVAFGALDVWFWSHSNIDSIIHDPQFTVAAVPWFLSGWWTDLSVVISDWLNYSEYWCHIMWFICCAWYLAGTEARYSDHNHILILISRTHTPAAKRVESYVEGFGIFRSVMWPDMLRSS